MPMLRITSGLDGPVLHDGHGHFFPALSQALDKDPGPVTLLLHGFKYEPGHPMHCPHISIQARSPQKQGPKVVSWPRHLGLRGQPGEGLGISFGWPARGSLWQAFARSDQAARDLAEVLATIRRIDPERPIRAIGHSMGARVILRALAQSAAGALDHAVLLAGAEFHQDAQKALQSPGGASCAVLNVTSRENDLYDFMIERLIAAPRDGDRMLGFQDLRLPNMVTLQIDDAQSLRALRRAGHKIARPSRLICHWSTYRRPGVFPLYRAFLDGQMPLSQLRAILPDETAPRWSRLLPRPAQPLLGASQAS